MRTSREEMTNPTAASKTQKPAMPSPDEPVSKTVDANEAVARVA